VPAAPFPRGAGAYLIKVRPQYIRLAQFPVRAALYVSLGALLTISSLVQSATCHREARSAVAISCPASPDMSLAKRIINHVITWTDRNRSVAIYCMVVL
jgi:hypothetical protein